MKRVISTILTITFLVSNVSFAAEIRPSAGNANLAPAVISSPLGDENHKNATIAEIILEGILKKTLDGVPDDQLNDPAFIKKALRRYTDTLHSEDTKYDPAMVYFNQLEQIAPNIYKVPCSVSKVRSLFDRKRWDGLLLFSTKKDGKFYPVTPCTAEELEEVKHHIAANILPVRNERDREIMEEYARHEKYDKNVIKWAHDNPDIAKRIIRVDPNLVRGCLEYILYRTNVKTSISKLDIPVDVAPLTKELKTRIRENMVWVTAMGPDGKPIRKKVAAYASTSNNTRHMFLEERQFLAFEDAIRTRDLNHAAALLMFNGFVHEVGVRLGCKVLRFDEVGRPVNEIDDRYFSEDVTNRGKRFKVANLDIVAGRDYAASLPDENQDTIGQAGAGNSMPKSRHQNGKAAENKVQKKIRIIQQKIQQVVDKREADIKVLQDAHNLALIKLYKDLPGDDNEKARNYRIKEMNEEIDIEIRQIEDGANDRIAKLNRQQENFLSGQMEEGEVPTSGRDTIYNHRPAARMPAPKSADDKLSNGRPAEEVFESLYEKSESLIGLDMTVKPVPSNIGNIVEILTPEDINKLIKLTVERMQSKDTQSDVTAQSQCSAIMAYLMDRRDKMQTRAAQAAKGGMMGRWKYDSVTLSPDGTSLTLHNPARIPNKDGIIEGEFKNPPKEITLQVRNLNSDEYTKISPLIRDLGISTTYKVIVRDESAMKYRIYGFALHNTPFIREDILSEGNPDQIKEALDHENQELTTKSHDAIRKEQHQGNLRSLIRKLSDKDKAVKEKADAEGVAKLMRMPLNPTNEAINMRSMARRLENGGFDPNGAPGPGVAVGAAINGSYALDKNGISREGNQGYYVGSGLKVFTDTVHKIWSLFKDLARLGRPINIVIKAGIGGQHTSFQAIADAFHNFDPNEKIRIVGEYELGKDYEAALQKLLDETGARWDQIAIIPSSKSGSTDETMLIATELMRIMFKRMAMKNGLDKVKATKLAKVVLDTMHNVNFDEKGEVDAASLFKKLAPDKVMGAICSVPELKHVRVADVYEIFKNVLENMFFETTDRPEQSRLSAFMRNSWFGERFGPDGIRTGAMFDNVGGRWTADLHMTTFLAFYELDCVKYWKIRKAGIEKVREGTHLGNTLGNRILDEGVTDIAFIVPDELFWFGKSIEQNFNESIWQNGFANLRAIKASDWQYQEVNYANKPGRLVINLSSLNMKEGPYKVSRLEPFVIKNIDSRQELAEALGELYTTFYGMTITVGDRLIARALAANGFIPADVDVSDLDNPATKIFMQNLYLRQPYVEGGKKLLEKTLKELQRGGKDSIDAKFNEAKKFAENMKIESNIGIAMDSCDLPGLIRAAQQAKSLAEKEGRVFVPFIYLEGQGFVDLREHLTRLGVEWVLQGTGDQHISYQQVLAQPQKFLPFIISFVPQKAQEGLPAVGFGKGYLHNVSPHMVRDLFAEASYHAFVDKRYSEAGKEILGAKGIFMRISDSNEGRAKLKYAFDQVFVPKSKVATTATRTLRPGGGTIRTFELKVNAVKNLPEDVVVLDKGPADDNWWERETKAKLAQNPTPWGRDSIVPFEEDGVVKVRVTKKMLDQYSTENPEGRGIMSSFEKYAELGPKSIAGIRDMQNISNIHDTRQVKNSFERLLTTVSLGLMVKIMYNKGEGFPYQATYGHEVRYNSNEYQDITTRTLAAMGFICHTVPDNVPTAIWNTSTMGKFFDFVLSFCGTSSHSDSEIDGLKIMDYEGSQFLKDPINAMIGIQKAIIKKIEKDGEFVFTMSAKDDPRITDELYRLTHNGMYVYKKYQEKTAADDYILNLVKSLNPSKLHIDCAHGSGYRALTAFLNEMGLAGLSSRIDWMHKEERPDFGNIGKTREDPRTGEKKLSDLGADVTQVFEKVLPSRRIVKYVPVLCTADYPERFAAMPVGDIILHTDMDNDRLAVSQILTNDKSTRDLLEKLGVVYNVINKEKIVALFVPNKFFHFLHQMNFERITTLMDQGKVDKNRTMVVLKTFASTPAVDKWAEMRKKEGYKVEVINTGVGFAKFANIMYRAEGEMRKNPGKDVIIKDALNRDINIGPNPIILTAWEESGGIITGITYGFSDILGNKFLAEREKSATESIFLSLALISKLQRENAGVAELAHYLDSLYRKDYVDTPIDERREDKLFTPGGGAKEEQAKREGDAKKNRIFGAHLSLVMALTRNEITMQEARKILKDIFAQEYEARKAQGKLHAVMIERFKQVDVDSLVDIKFTGDGVMYIFEKLGKKWMVLFRPSGTDPKLKSYAFGDDTERLVADVWAFAYNENTAGKLPDSFTLSKALMSLWGEDGTRAVDRADRMQSAWETYGVVVDPEDPADLARLGIDRAALEKRRLERSFTPPDNQLQVIQDWLKKENLGQLNVNLGAKPAMPQQDIVGLLDAIPENVYKQLGRNKEDVLAKEREVLKTALMVASGEGEAASSASEGEGVSGGGGSGVATPVKSRHPGNPFFLFEEGRNRGNIIIDANTVIIGTGGGDCAGLNDMIAATVKKLNGMGKKVLGIKNCYDGMVSGDWQDRLVELTSEMAIAGLPSTVLGSCRRKLSEKDLTLIAERFKGCAGFIITGGNDHLKEAAKISNTTGIFTVGVPKSIDNDFHTAMLGFNSAVLAGRRIAARASIDPSKSDGNTVAVFEVMGRKSGSLTAEISKACPYPKAVIIPEKNVTIDQIIAAAEAGVRNFFVSEGFSLSKDDPRLKELLNAYPTLREIYNKALKNPDLDAHGNPKLAGASRFVAGALAYFCGLKVERTDITYQLRGAAPQADDGREGKEPFDTFLANKFAEKAAELLIKGEDRGMALTYPDYDNRDREVLPMKAEYVYKSRDLSSISNEELARIGVIGEGLPAANTNPDFVKVQGVVRSAEDAARRLFYAIGISTLAHRCASVVELRLPPQTIRAACGSLRPGVDGFPAYLKTVVDAVKDSTLVLAPDEYLSFEQIRERILTIYNGHRDKSSNEQNKALGYINVAISSEFRIKENDPLFRKICEDDSRLKAKFEKEAVATGTDEAGNRFIKFDTGVSNFIYALFKESGFDEKLRRVTNLGYAFKGLPIETQAAENAPAPEAKGESYAGKSVFSGSGMTTATILYGSGTKKPFDGRPILKPKGGELTPELLKELLEGHVKLIIRKYMLVQAKFSKDNLSVILYVPYVYRSNRVPEYERNEQTINAVSSVLGSYMIGIKRMYPGYKWQVIVSEDSVMNADSGAMQTPIILTVKRKSATERNNIGSVIQAEQPSETRLPATTTPVPANLSSVSLTATQRISLTKENEAAEEVPNNWPPSDFNGQLPSYNPQLETESASVLDEAAIGLVKKSVEIVLQLFANKGIGMNTLKEEIPALNDLNIMDEKTAFVFSPKATFGYQAENGLEPGLGPLLKIWANAGIPVAVIIENERQAELIKILNKDIDQDKRIRYGYNLEDIRPLFTKRQISRYYYLKTKGEDPISGVMDFRDIVVKKILDAIGELRNIVGQDIIDLRSAAIMFAQSA